jgi:hypothetical protein
MMLRARRLTPYSMALYEASDLALLILSMMQATTFEAWRRLGASSDGVGSLRFA